MILLWLFHRTMAIHRHQVLVDFWYLPEHREEAMERHVDIVKRVYGA